MSKQTHFTEEQLMPRPEHYINPIKQSLENLTRLLQEQKKAIDKAIDTIDVEYKEVGNEDEYDFLGI